MFPPASGFYLMASAAVLAVGMPANLVHAKLQERKFSKKMDKLLDNSDNPKHKLTEAEKAEKASMQELKKNIHNVITEDPKTPKEPPEKSSSVEVSPPIVEKTQKKSSEMVQLPKVKHDITRPEEPLVKAARKQEEVKLPPVTSMMRESDKTMMPSSRIPKATRSRT